MQAVAGEVFNNLFGWITANGAELTIIQKIIKIIFLLIALKVSIKISYILIDKFFANQGKLKYKIEKRKADTLSVILKSIVRYVLYFVALVPILEVFGISPASILAAAGIGGVAIGFGAKSLVEDVITGFFILFEDQYSVGDYVEIQDFDGVVEEIGLRVTKLRAFSGKLHIIPNGNVTSVTNMCRGAMRAWVDIGIAYEEDIDNAINVINRVTNELKESNQHIVEGPTVLGVSNLGNSDVVLSIIAKTKPLEQWTVERQIRQKVKEEFDKEGIEIPYPRRVVIDGNE